MRYILYRMRVFLIVLFCLSTPFYADQLSVHSQKAQEVVDQYSQNRSEVIKMAETFLNELRQVYDRGEGLIERDLHRIYDAVCFATIKHQHQVRLGKNQIPYIIHPIGVTHSLIDIGNVRDPDIIIAALLHDTVEDTETTFDEINAAFGPRVEGFVREVTDDTSLEEKEIKQHQILSAPHKSAGAAQIKLADKLYNLKDLLREPLADWGVEPIKKYFAWAKQVIDALSWVNAPLKKAVDDVLSSAK